MMPVLLGSQAVANGGAMGMKAKDHESCRRPHQNSTGYERQETIPTIPDRRAIAAPPPDANSMGATPPVPSTTPTGATEQTTQHTEAATGIGLVIPPARKPPAMSPSIGAHRPSTGVGSTSLEPFRTDVAFAPVDVFRQRSRERSNSICSEQSSSGTPRRRSGSFNSMSPNEQRQLQNLITNANVPEKPPLVPSKPQREKEASSRAAGNAVLILDWDDTLFPTTWIRQDVGLDWTCPLEDQLLDIDAHSVLPMQGGVDTGRLIRKLLKRHSDKVCEFLEEAFSMAHVFIVTLAKPGWVEAAARNFLPELAELLEKRSAKVIYAQDHCNDVTPADQSKFQSSVDQACDYWSRVKEKAILVQLLESNPTDKMQDGVVWDKLISIGDSDFERVGAISAGKEYKIAQDARGGNSDKNDSIFQTKTFKMVTDPTIEELTAQLILLKLWLPFISEGVDHDNLEIENTEDDEILMQLHKEITGEDVDLHWAELAGMGMTG